MQDGKSNDAPPLHILISYAANECGEQWMYTTQIKRLGVGWLLLNKQSINAHCAIYLTSGNPEAGRAQNAIRSPKETLLSKDTPASSIVAGLGTRNLLWRNAIQNKFSARGFVRPRPNSKLTDREDGLELCAINGLGLSQKQSESERGKVYSQP